MQHMKRRALQTASGDGMADAIKTWTILIEAGALLPESLRLECELYSNGWTSFRNLDRHELEREIKNAGWTFFYMAGEIKTTAFGFDKQKTVRAAVKRLITTGKSDACNCVEITRVATKDFLGVIYVSVSAHARHIQESLCFSHKAHVTVTAGNR